MSRSYKKHPFTTWVVAPRAGQQKQYKTMANRKLRRTNKLRMIQAVQQMQDAIFLNHIKEALDIWCFPSDGKPYYVPSTKDPSGQLWSTEDYEQFIKQVVRK